MNDEPTTETQMDPPTDWVPTANLRFNGGILEQMWITPHLPDKPFESEWRRVETFAEK